MLSNNLQGTTPKAAPKTPQTPSISITALPRQMNNMIPNNSRNAAANAFPKPPPGMANIKPGQTPPGGKSPFIICEICDGYINDLDQLRNHMQWMHKVKVSHTKIRFIIIFFYQERKITEIKRILCETTLRDRSLTE